MRHTPHRCFLLTAAAWLCLALGVAGCGGGGATNGPLVLNEPAPAEPAAPPPPPNYDTAEYRENYGLVSIGAITAYDAGLSGDGVAVAVIDSGIDRDHPELDSVLHPASTNIVTGVAADVEDADTEDGHGTIIAGIIAAERNGVGVHGVAFGSQIMAIGAVDPALCTADDCTFSQFDLARAVDHARTEGARVINLSLGGAAPGPTLAAALETAVNAGMVIVISAGNDSEASPSTFAAIAGADWANGQIVIAGASDSTNTIADFSNRAGPTLQDVYVVAPGVLVTSTGVGGGYVIASGTSFAAPHVAGAMALLLEAFPNLTAGEVAEILVTTARDLGDPGVDAIYGRGLVDLAAALAPVGPVSIAVDELDAAEGGSAPALDQSGLSLSRAFGDGLGQAPGLTAAMGLDSYRRSYRLDLSRQTLRARPDPDLLAIAATRLERQHRSYLSQGPLEVDARWHWDGNLAQWSEHYLPGQGAPQAARPTITAEVRFALSPATRIEATSRRNRYDGLFLAEAGPDALEAPARDGVAVSLHHRMSDRLGWSVEMARARLPESSVDAEGAHVSAMGAQVHFAADRALRLTARMGIVDEDNAVLGARSAGGLKLATGAQTVTGALRLDWDAGAVDFYLAGGLARTRVEAANQSLFQGLHGLWASHFRAGVVARDLLRTDDRFGFEASQPLRLEGGTAMIRQVTGRDYERNRLTFVDRATRLVPGGRELDFQAGYGTALQAGGTLRLQILHQVNAGHVAGRSATAVLAGYSSRF